MDFIMNGQGHGGVAAALLNNGFDVGVMRPYVGEDGRSYITRNVDGKNVAVPLNNYNATLRIREWIELDTAVITAAKERLAVVADLRSRGLTYTLPNGMGKTVLESQTMSDITPATISMDPARQSEGDRPEFGIQNLPLPVIHKDFHFTARQVATSRNGGAPIDTATAQLAARRVSEEAEKLTLGTAPVFSYGGGVIYGFTNFPNRITKDLTDPTSSGWVPNTLVKEILDMRQKSIDVLRFGPWGIYCSTGWSQYLDEDYSPLKGDLTLRQRILAIENIQFVTSADYLPGLQIVLVQLTSDVVRMVIGMDITTIQWESLGGMRLDFKVMSIMVPQLRAVDDSFGTHLAGIVHGAVTEGG